jgi:enoyl-CoA hydratase/carnithine racemase
MSDHWQFNTDRTYPGVWTITFDNPPINMFGPATIVELAALMADLESDPSAKARVNRFGKCCCEPAGFF